MHYLYVIKLEDGCYYCGHTENPDKRMHDHSIGDGSKWCKLHPPLMPVNDHFAKHATPQMEEMSEVERTDMEDELCEFLQNKYGLNKVRGGYLVCGGTLKYRPPRDNARKFYYKLIGTPMR